MELNPTFGHVICELVSLNGTVIKNGVSFKQESFDIYKILKSNETQNDLRYTVNDLIISNSIPTKVNLEGKILYIVKIENIIGKIYE